MIAIIGATGTTGKYVVQELALKAWIFAALSAKRIGRVRRSEAILPW
jgi:uncharacterized protein YbjT (DUF2867 family)